MELIVKLGGEFMRKIIHINDQWFYANDYKGEYLKNEFDFSNFERVDLPLIQI